jgi:hypothetical protein
MIQEQKKRAVKKNMAMTTTIDRQPKRFWPLSMLRLRWE